MMDYQAALNELARRFTVASAGGTSALEPTFRINPPGDAAGPDGLALTETVTRVAPVDVPVDVDLRFVGKWVRAATSDLPADPATEDPIGGMPVVEQVQVITGTTGSLSTGLPTTDQMTSDPQKELVPGVPELLGRLKGSITQTVERVTEVLERYPITLDVRWRLLDASSGGAPVAATGVSYRVDPNSPWQPLPDPLELPDVDAPALSLKFPAMCSELTTAVPEVMTFSLRPSVRLGLTLPPTTPPAPPPPGPFTTDWVDLPAVPLVVPTVPVPTILVLFENRDFTGRRLVLVPGSSPLGAEAGAMSIAAALELASSALQGLVGTHGFLDFLAATSGGAGAAASALKSLAPTYKHTLVKAYSRVDNLGADEFIIDPGGLFWINRLTGEDMASSIICVGRPGAVFDMFDHRDLDEGITRLQVTVDGSVACAMSRVDEPNPRVAYGGAVTSHRPTGGYEDRISSVNLNSPGARFTPL